MPFERPWAALGTQESSLGTFPPCCHPPRAAEEGTEPPWNAHLPLLLLCSAPASPLHFQKGDLCRQIRFPPAKINSLSLNQKRIIKKITGIRKKRRKKNEGSLCLNPQTKTFPSVPNVFQVHFPSWFIVLRGSRALLVLSAAAPRATQFSLFLKNGCPASLLFLELSFCPPALPWECWGPF